MQAESAIAALNCSGVVLGSLPIRSDCILFSHFCFQPGMFIEKAFYRVCVLLGSKSAFAVIHNQGKPIKDACSATCSSPSYTLIIFAGPETDISAHLYI